MQRAVAISFIGAAFCAALVWFTFSNPSGQIEPWDEPAGAYAAALILAGIVCGAGFKEPMWALYVGALIGQLLAMVILGQVGPLLLVGVLFLLFYTLLFLAGAFFGSAMRRSLS